MSALASADPAALRRGRFRTQRLIGLLRQPVDELRRRQPQLAVAAEISLIAIAPCLLAMMIDARTVNGISVWIKPVKFLLSFSVYYATLAWVFGFLPRSAQEGKAGRFVIVGALAAGAFEIAWLLLAAGAGVPAHFNRASPAWAMAYSLAGLGAVVLVSAILVQGLMVARARGLPVAPALRWSLVAGALLASVGTLVVAGYLSAADGHWVGGDATDATGLPWMGWSRTGGDLRVAHFWALHAQQALPLLGLLLVAAGRPQARGAVVLATIAYAALIVATFVQALDGRPFLPFLG